MRITVFATLILFPLLGFSQKNIEQKSSIEIIREGYAAFEDKKYEESIELYSKISINDTNYTLSQYEKAYSYFSLLEYDNAAKTLEDVLKLDLLYKTNQDVYSLLGSAYDEAKKMDLSIEAYTRGIKKFPKAYNLYYNRALVYTKLNKHKESIEDLKMAVTCYSGHAASHYHLGLYAFNEGHYTEAAMSLITNLFLDPTSDYANHTLVLLENISSGSAEEVSKNFNWDEEDDFKDISVLFKNRVALEKAYKVKLSVNCSYGKQLHFLLSNLKYDKNNKGFWNQTYLPLLLDVMKNNQFDNMILYSLQSSNSAKVISKIKSKRAKIDAFLKYAQPAWVNFSGRKYIEFEGKKQDVYIVYGTKCISRMGKINDQNQSIGTWYSFHPNGSVDMIAKYDDKGVQQGEWVTYNMYNGQLATKIPFDDDKVTGDVKIYYLHGELREKKTYKEDIQMDTVFMYYRSGDIMRTYVVKNDLKNGESIQYHENGQIDYKCFYKDDLYDGSYKAYHTNGQLALDFKYVNDKADGPYLKYYPNGQKMISCTYVLDLMEGTYENWYSDGTKKEVSNFKAGTQIGEYKLYYSNGQISESGIYDESGKNNGTITKFDLDGIKYGEFIYKKGELVEMSSFNKKGEQFYKSNKKGKKIEYKVHYPNGVLKTDGVFENEIREGDWKYFDEYGNLETKEVYVKGLITDTAFIYFPNGNLSVVNVYKDGVLNGLSLNYNSFGQLIREGLYVNGSEEKDWYSYYDNGVLSIENFYTEGSLHGVQVYYDVNGKLDSYKEYEYGRLVSQDYTDTLGNIIDSYGEFHGDVVLHDASNSFVRFEGHFQNGLNTGITKYYNPNKKIQSIGKHINDLREGDWKTYNEDGILTFEGNYINGEREGVVKLYYDNGAIKSISNYKQGELNGQDVDYYDNGKKEIETTYLDGKKHGKATYYDEEGNVFMYRYFDYGVFRSYSYLGKDGKEVAKIDLKLGNNLIVTYYSNGKKANEHNRKNGLIEGHYITYNSKGILYEDCHNGNLCGARIT